eukprot:2627705-Prymnesium_polylepis.1
MRRSAPATPRHATRERGDGAPPTACTVAGIAGRVRIGIGGAGWSPGLPSLDTRRCSPLRSQVVDTLGSVVGRARGQSTWACSHLGGGSVRPPGSPPLARVCPRTV